MIRSVVLLDILSMSPSIAIFACNATNPKTSKWFAMSVPAAWAIFNVVFTFVELDWVRHPNFMKWEAGIIRGPNNHELLTRMICICSLDEVDSK